MFRIQSNLKTEPLELSVELTLTNKDHKASEIFSLNLLQKL